MTLVCSHLLSYISVGSIGRSKCMVPTRHIPVWFLSV